MGFRKFGTSDDQKVVPDQEDTQGVRKESSRGWTERDEDELRRESEGTTRTE